MSASRAVHRRVVGAVIGSAGLAAALAAGSSPATANGPKLGFTPITTNALPCSAGGYIQFANDARNRPVTPKVLMQAGDPATPVNAPATSNKVGRENDMIALSRDGRYLFTSSENANPSETGAPDGSDGITRLTLKGPHAGTKEILADNVDPATGANLWQRVDGMKLYPYGGHGQGVLLASEEFATGGIWQVNPDTGDFTRLDWLGNYAHEGIGLDKAGNLYLGDESRTGALYRAVPSDRRDLTQGRHPVLPRGHLGRPERLEASGQPGQRLDRSQRRERDPLRPARRLR